MTNNISHDDNKKLNHYAINLWITVLAIRRPVTTFMIMLSLFVTGLIASRLLPQESLPALTVPVAFISVPYPGATPQEVERLITRPLEEALATMGDITEMRSRSRANFGSVQLVMKLSVDLDSKIMEVREKVDMVRHLLPDDIEQIRVQKFSTEDLPVIDIVISSEQDISKAYDFLEKRLKQPLERLAGVGKTEFRGVNEPSIQILLDSTKVSMNRVNQDQLLADLRKSNFLIKSGTILDGGKKFRVSPDGEYKSVNDIKDFQVKDGVKLSDIATISWHTPDRNSEIRTDRRKSVGIEVYKESDANVVQVTRSVVALIDELKNDPDFAHLTLATKNDSGEDIQTSLADLLKAGTLGMLLSFAVLFVFLRNIPITLIVVASVPISLSFAVAGMYFMGFSLNLLTLAGLFIAVGLLIDNSVVICESILQQQKNSLSKIQRILVGVDNVSIAVICGTLTTAIVFFPLLMGEKNFITILVEQLAVAICLPLLASLFIAKTIIPLMLSRVGKNALANVTTQGRLDKWYRPALVSVLTKPKLTGFVVFLLCVLGIMAKQMVSANQEQSEAEKEIFIRYHVHGEQKLADVSKLVDNMERYLYDNQQAFHFSQVNSRIFPGFASSRIVLNDDVPVPIHELKETIRAGFPKSAIAKPSFEWSEKKEKRLQLTLNGSSTKELMILGESILPRLNAIDGFEDVGIDNDTNKKELILRIDRDRIARIGVDASQVASRISTALRGVNLRTFRDQSQGEVAIRLVYDAADALPIEQVKSLPILENEGRFLTLSQLVVFDSEPAMQQITRSQRRTNLTITVNLNDISRQEAAKKLTEVMDNVAFPSGYDWNVGRQFQQDKEALREMMLNMLLALALIFIVMAALFESLLMPIAILSSIGLAFIGVYFTFAILGMGLGETGTIGMLILMGIVVNNGIVLIDQINKLKGSSSDLLTPIIDACVTRIRPIFMTVATTVIGMAPLALASSDNQAYPMAVAIIGGLLFSTLTSLFLVPYCYLMLIKLGERSARRFALAKQFADKRVKA